jgi:hypothetical protein
MFWRVKKRKKCRQAGILENAVKLTRKIVLEKASFHQILNINPSLLALH